MFDCATSDPATQEAIKHALGIAGAELITEGIFGDELDLIRAGKGVSKLGAFFFKRIGLVLTAIDLYHIRGCRAVRREVHDFKGQVARYWRLVRPWVFSCLLLRYSAAPRSCLQR